MSKQPLAPLAVLAVLATLTAGLVIAACGTIMHGSMQDVSFTSAPAGAQVTVDTARLGPTPVVAKLRRKDRHVVRIELAGYQPFEMALQRKTDGWVWGNILFGGLIGLVVDASTGGMYKIEPAVVQASLTQGSARVSRQGDVIAVAVVLHADPSWERIARLAPE